MRPDQLIDKWKHVLAQALHVFTWTEPASLAYCAEIASRSLVGVESGTYMGASAFVMLRANPKLHLWCVDKFEVAGTEMVSRYFLSKEIAEGRCEIIVGDSERAAGMLQHVSLDMAWIDDGHATEDVKRDIRCLLPLIRPGGVIFGHDFDVPHNDVALGVIASLPHWEMPVPRVWSYTKP